MSNKSALGISIGVAFSVALGVTSFLVGANVGEDRGEEKTSQAVAQAKESTAAEWELKLRRAENVFNTKTEQMGEALFKATQELVNNKLPSQPCLTEDSKGPCFWDAGTRGNGKGRSFWVDINGGVHYLDGGR